MKHTLLKIVTGLCALLVFLPATGARAAVDFTKDGAAHETSVYVAGAPDAFPVESYEAASGTYIGAAPAFLALAAEQTGLNFVYIRAGEQDRRETLARNCQVDLVFAWADEQELLDLGVENIKLFSVLKNGTPTDVYCVFTSVMGAQERAQIRTVAGSLTKDDIARLLTAASSESFSQRQFYMAVIGLGGLLLAAVAGLVIFFVLFSRSRRKKSAFIDAVTNIGNKEYFTRAFGATISEQTRELYYVVHLAFAIDRINHSFGPEEADKVLRFAAKTITQWVKKKQEFCARTGGGAFAAAILADGTGEAGKRVEEILHELNAYGEKHLSGEGKTLFRAGICALAGSDDGAEKALDNASHAWRRAGEEKKEYVFASRDVLRAYRAKLSIREQVGQAVEQRAFTPYVQMIVSARDGQIRGGELLSRWDNREYGLLSPGNYIPVLQEMGLIVRHDLLMLEEACRILERWQAAGKFYFLACNLTRVTISDPTLVDRILAIAERYSFIKAKLILEVTEDSLEEDKENALRNMLSLKEQGFRVALDDFSSGYTAVTNLYEYSVDLVKLDRHMILDADRDPNAAALMKEITRLCHELRINVLAEGVETEAQVRQVRAASCDYIQGYFYARALPIRELDAFEEGYRPKEIPGQAEPAATPETPAAAAPETPAAAVPETPAAAVPETPAAAAPETPAAAAPETPAAAAPETPAAAAPETPAAAVPETPAAAAPETPAAAVPETPAAAAPVTPAAAAPVAPAAAVPVAPAAAAPVAPAAAVPVAPAAAVPETPAAAVPETPAAAVTETPAAAVTETPAAAAPETPAAAAPEADEADKAPAPVRLEAAGRTEGADRNTLHIQYGSYSMDLPGDIDLDPVSELLRAIQKKAPASPAKKDHPWDMKHRA